jgi:hypothetical protein
LRAFALVLLLAAGCGYHFTAGGGPLPGSARTLFVPVFKNTTTEPGVEGIFTDAFREELSRWGREGGEASDAAVDGSVTSVSSGGAIVTSLGATPVIASYRVQATVKLRVIKDGQQIAQTTVGGSEDYLPQRPCSGTEECPAASSPRANARGTYSLTAAPRPPSRAQGRQGRCMLHRKVASATGPAEAPERGDWRSVPSGRTCRSYAQRASSEPMWRVRHVLKRVESVRKSRSDSPSGFGRV